MSREKFEKPTLMNKFLLIAAVFVTLVYAWLTSVALENRFEAPRSVVSHVAWLENHQVMSWAQVRGSKWRSSEWIQKTLVRFNNSLKILGGFRHAPDLLINSDESDRYTISDDIIELSEGIATADGQLEKALIKVWLLQRAGPEFSASLLRIEVVSDMLTAMLAGDEQFSLNEDNETFAISSVDNWLGFAKSFESNCGSKWRSLELRGFCGHSLAIDSLSFRPLLDAMIWQSYQDKPVFERVDFIRSWVRSLTLSDGKLVAIRRESPQQLSDWRDWLRGEYALLVPEIAASEVGKKAQLQAGLNDPLSVQVVIHHAGPEKVAENLQTAMERTAGEKPFAISIENEGAWLVTPRNHGQPFGWVRILDTDVYQMNTPLLVWQDCRPSILSNVIDYPIHSERVLYALSCSGHPSNAWIAVVREGLRGFSRAEPSVSFVQIHRESVMLALKYGQIGRADLISNFMSKNLDQAGRVLGLDAGKWEMDMQAYHVLGAIEAIEWYRSPRL